MVQLLPQLLPPHDDPPHEEELPPQECDELEDELQEWEELEEQLWLEWELDEQLWLECEECECECDPASEELDAISIAKLAPASSPLLSYVLDPPYPSDDRPDL